jgi:shikimate kinase
MTRSTRQAPERNKARSIVLVGFSGSGKSTVGPLLAERLQWPLFDTDALVEAAACKSVAAVFKDHGEALFRDLEAQACVRAAAGARRIVATGAGALLRDTTRDMFERACTVVVLQVDAGTASARLDAATDRPLLDGDADDRTKKLKALLGARQRFYASFENQVATVGRTPEQVATEIANRFAPAIASSA